MMYMITNAANENLAKLMSSEDIGVTYGNVETAYFNTETRTLMLPNWEGLKEIELEMIIAHEIGHALYTPAKEWKETILSMNPPTLFKYYLNIVEDARIEKLVKRKFPGTKKIFYFGYASLNEREDLFSKNYSEYTFIDYINLYYKLGGIRKVNLTEKHKYFIEKMDLMESFEDAVSITKEIFDYCKNDLLEEMSNLNSVNSESSGESEVGDQKSDSSDNKRAEGVTAGAKQNSQSKEDEKSESNSASGKNPNNESSEGRSDKDSPGGSGLSANSDKQPAKPKTSDSLENSLSKKISSNIIYTSELPEPILENIIHPYKQVLYDHSNEAIYRIPKPVSPKNSNSDYLNLEDDESLDEDAELKMADEDLEALLKDNNLNTFMKKNASTIAYHKQLFEMRKKAIEHNRTLTFRSGLLDMNKIHSYKYDDQIFKTFQIKETGKKHGLIFFLDMSGSMFGYISGAIKKMLEIVLFCKQTSIPFTVYGFTSQNFSQREKFHNYGNMEYKMSIDTNFSLIEFLSHSMTAVEFKKGFEILSKRIGTRGSLWQYQLGGTPLNEAILCLDSIVKKFRNSTNAQIVNVVFFTDGAGSPFGYTRNNSSNTKNHYNRPFSYDVEKTSNFILYDRKTKKNYSLSHKDQQLSPTNDSVYQISVLLDIMRNRLPNTNILNYYIVYDIWTMLSDYELISIDPNKNRNKPKSKYSWSEVREVRDHFNNDIMILVKNKYNGFDQAYVISTSYFTENTKKRNTVVTGQKLSLKEEFQKTSRNRKLTNKLISDFIDTIV